MNASVYHIPILNLGWVLGLILLVTAIHVRWSLEAKTVLYATFRMTLQLTLVGFFLVYIFGHRNSVIVCLLLSAMLMIASWITLRPLKNERTKLYSKTLFALVVGCVPVLIVVIAGVVHLSPWYEPRYVIPLAGMIFANAMNSVSLAAERFQAEAQKGVTFVKARNAAFQTALLPITNSFFAAGIVSLPGMMTGQILAGVSPLLAVRYQIVVMGMLFGASGIAAAAYLTLLKRAWRPSGDLSRPPS